MPVPRVFRGEAAARRAPAIAANAPINSRLVTKLAIAFLPPGVAAIMIAALFPKALTIGGHEFDAPQPFGALPEIELGHDGAHRAAMLARQRPALPGMGEQHVLVVEIGE